MPRRVATTLLRLERASITVPITNSWICLEFLDFGHKKDGFQQLIDVLGLSGNFCNSEVSLTRIHRVQPILPSLRSGLAPGYQILLMATMIGTLAAFSGW